MQTQIQFHLASTVDDDAIAEKQSAQELTKTDKRRGLAALNEIFRAGTAPNPQLDGRYAGKLIALDVAPGLTKFGELISAAWMPWKGKTFDRAKERGDNIFTRDSMALSNVFWPFYCGTVHEGPATFRAFEFKTCTGSGLMDPDRQVLKIDYALDENPRTSVRRVLDELVEVSEGFYLGKAHLRWWWGKWQTVAYFTLESADRRTALSLA